MLRKLLAVAAFALAMFAMAEPALAQRGDHNRDDRRGGDDRGWDRDSRDRDSRDRNWGDGHRDRDHDRGRRDRGSSWGGGWDRDWDRGYSGWGYSDWGRGYGRHHYRDDDWWIGLYAGSALLDLLTPESHYYSGDAYGYSSYPVQAPNAWGLYPNQCRWDREFGYWYNRPADIEVQRCADGYGSVYVVQGSHRLWRYR